MEFPLIVPARKTLLEMAVRSLKHVSFSRVHVALGDARNVSPDTPLLLVANHVSWWDGLLLRDVCGVLRPGALRLTIMSSGELARRPYLADLGGVGIDDSIASIRRMYREISRAREDAGGALAVSYFPQGRIWPSTRQPLGFRGGVTRVARLLSPVALLPVAIHIEPLATLRPHAFVVVGPPLAGGGELHVTACESAVQRTLSHLHAYLAETGEDAARRWETFA